MKAKSTVKRALTAVAVALFWLIIWEAAALLVAKPVLLPTPVATVKTLVLLMKEKAFYISCSLSIVRIALGFIFGVFAGTVLGALTYRFKSVSALLTPLNALIKATPIASFIILLLVWLSKGTIPSFTSFLIVTPVIWSVLKSSLESVDAKTLEAARVFALPLFKKIRYIYIPSVRNKYLASLETALGLSWKAGIAAEVLCTPKFSIGGELYNSKIYLDTNSLFAWTLCVIVISLMLELLIKKLAGKLFKTEDGKNEA